MSTMFYNFVEFKSWFLNQKTLGTGKFKNSRQRSSVGINVLPLLAMVFAIGMAAGLNAQVTVNVFRDYDADGTDDGTGEPGITGLTVTAFDAAGAATALTDGGNGTYTFAGGSGPYRIEVTGVASFLHPTNAQAVVVASSGTVTIGFQSPADFCQAAPDLVTPVWCNGDPLLTGNASTFNTLVKMPYTSPTSQTNLAQGAETGATYGIAYHRTAKKVFTSAVQRRHMGYGPLGTGGIYMVDPTSLTVTNFMNLNVAPISTGTNPHTTLPSGGTSPSYDIPSYDAVGKVSLGDMDISEDEKTLWVMNLFEQTLLKIPLGGTATNPTAPAIGSVVEFAWPTPCSPSTNKFRAWGVECHQDKVYIAGLCSEEETGGVVADLHVYIYELDPNATTPTFTLVYDFAGLNHTRGDAIDAGAQSGNWNTWKSTWATVTAAGPNNYVSLPQPMTTDLEFDKNGNIILGFSDRFGLQSGYRNYNISGSSTTLYSGATAGDIVKICKVGAAYILEGGVGCTQSYNNGTGYGGKEYYGDITSASSVLNPTTGEHEEATQGALAYNVSADAIVTNMTDPEALDSGGLSWFNAAGAVTDKYQVYDGTSNYVGKAAGLGDLELLCNPSTIEVGNLIWEDTDSDGIQDPNENGIGSLTVTLWKDDGTGNYSQISTTTTTSGGFYGFSNAASGTAGNGVVYNVTQLLPNMNYQIRVASGQTNNAAFTITDDNSVASGGNTTNNNKTDQRDSDANTSGVIAFSTGGFGQNNYTLDIGYSPAACSITNITFGTPSGCNDNSTNANSTDDWFTADITVTFSNPPASGNLVLSGDVLAGGGAISVTVATAGAGPTYTFTGVRLRADGTASAVTATFSADNTCTFSVTNGPNVPSCSIPPCIISSVTATPGACAPATNQYTVTGAVTFSDAPATGTLTVQITGGGSQVFNAPFISPLNYSIASQTSDGASHTVTATFSDDVACTNNVNYTAPASCQCIISSVTATPGACSPATNQYTVTGAITFTNPPATGTLTVQITGGGSQVFNAPFISPLNYSIASQTSDGASHTVTAAFSAGPTCTNTANYTAPASCQCNISSLTATPGSCAIATNQYTVTGAVTFTNAPATGTLTVQITGGGSQVFNAPFTSPLNYSIANQTSDGASHTVTATFSADAGCTQTANYTAPAACQCNISSLTATPGACAPATNQYTLTGVVTFINAPATGTLTVQITGGGSQVFNAPFSSPLNYSIASQTSDGVSHTVTASFSADAACTRTANYTAPANCLCSISSVTATPGLCAPATNHYTVTGAITFVNPPATGTLTVQITGGGSQVFNAPFTSPLNYSIASQTSDGAPHTVTATFSAMPACSQTANYTAPAPCKCTVTGLSANPGACSPVVNTYSLTGTVTYVAPPATGTLVVTVVGAGSQTFNAPFLAPINYSFSGLNSDGANHSVIATFSADAGCTQTVYYTAPSNCTACPSGNCATTIMVKN